MKKNIYLIITLIISLLFINKLDALTGYTTHNEIAIRTEPRVADNTFVTYVNKNVTLDVLSKDLQNVGDRDCPIGWYKINYNNAERYICGEYVSLGETPDDNPSYNEETYEARITDTRATVRKGPSFSYGSYYELLPGTNVVILEKIAGKANDCPDGWYKIRYFKDQVGYTCGANVSKRSELIASNPDYENYLKGLGFPDTYIPYLVKLHELHPNWTFNPILTNTDWTNLVNIENGRNSVQNTYLPSLMFDIYQQGPLPGEQGWYITTDEVNAFFLDPRNFLTEKFIFMYEKLNYDYVGEAKGTFNLDNNQVKHYYKLITYTLQNVYTNTDEYKNWILEGGYDSGVSPLYLAALSYQEGPMSNPTNPSIIGTHSKLYTNGNREYDVNGYYNFYNINAFKQGSNGTITNGLGFACGPNCGNGSTYKRPWNNKKDAIQGGALWIYDNYLAIGQNTMYFKKFNSNPAPGYSLGGHQYQTNITAPCTEALKLYKTYVGTNELNNAFIFDIPVYKNMPTVVSLPDLASTINTLNEIKVNGVKISSDIDVLDYQVYVPSSSTTAKIEVIKTDNKSTVKGDGDITLTGNTTEHKIIVTAENGATKTYRITLIKAEDNEIKDFNITIEEVISSLSVTNDNTINHISPNTVVDTIKQSILKVSPTTQVTIYNNGQIIEGATLLVTGSTIKIKVPSGATKTYTIIVNGDTNGDGKADILDLLKIQKHLLGTTKLNDLETKGGDTNFDGKIDILDLLLVQKYILGTSGL